MLCMAATATNICRLSRRNTGANVSSKSSSDCSFPQATRCALNLSIHPSMPSFGLNTHQHIETVPFTFFLTNNSSSSKSNKSAQLCVDCFFPFHSIYQVIDHFGIQSWYLDFSFLSCMMNCFMLPITCHQLSGMYTQVSPNIVMSAELDGCYSILPPLQLCAYNHKLALFADFQSKLLMAGDSV